MSRFVDLDAVARPDLEVKLGGQTYRVPGTVSTPRMLRWMQYELRAEDAAKAGDEREIISLAGEMYDDLVELFRIYSPDLEELDIDRDQTQALFAALNEQYNPEEEEEAANPTSTPRAAPKRKSAPRSGSRPTRASAS